MRTTDDWDAVEAKERHTERTRVALLLVAIGAMLVAYGHTVYDQAVIADPCTNWQGHTYQCPTSVDGRSTSRAVPPDPAWHPAMDPGAAFRPGVVMT